VIAYKPEINGTDLSGEKFMSRFAVRKLLLFTIAAVAITTCVGWAQEFTGREAIKPMVRPFDLKQVRLLDGPFRQAMERDRKYLHALDADRLLHTWRLNAGLASKAEPLGGWERPDCEVRGHTLGHYLSACALMYSSTGDERLKAKADGIVGKLVKCQDALANGYLSAFPESHIERAEKCERVWAPYYCLHKLIAGLLDMYVHCDNEEAFEAAKRMAAWCKSRCDKLSDEDMHRMLDRTEQGGMNEAFANLYGLTGDRQWLDLSRRFVQKRYVEPLARGEDRLKGEHVNSFIPNIIGTARQYELSGDELDRRIADYFWSQVTSARCYCTGGTSNQEHWRSDPHELAGQLSDHTQETCCTYNMLKLTRHLFCWNPKPEYGDYYERALYNSILSTQDPRTGMMMYFVTLASGRWKYYNLPNDSFWCCTASGLENHAKYGDSIYFHGENDLYVNLFIPSELNWTDKGVRVRQETGFPESETTTLTVQADKPAEFTMRVRVPYWATRAATAKLNGESIENDAKPSSWLSVTRKWKDGDCLEITLPMSLYAAPMPDDKTLVAVMYGPLVLAGKLGGEGLTDEVTYTTQNFFPFPRDKIASTPVFAVDSDDVSDWIEPVENQPLTFRATSEDQDITLVPYHKLFGERYAVYWRVYRRDSEEHSRALAEREAKAKRRARRVDEVAIGERESEQKHRMQGERTGNGSHMGYNWRHATDGGWFSYDVKVLPDGPMILWCRYWGDESGNRTFDVLVDDEKIATQTLQHNKPGEFFEVEYPIPPELTRGKKAITVRFQGQPGNFAGGVFGCEILKGE